LINREGQPLALWVCCYRVWLFRFYCNLLTCTSCRKDTITSL